MVTKTKKACPFSGRQCIECALYRGRHYFLCFSKHYNENLEHLEDLWKQRRAKGSHNGTFGMPDVIPTSSNWISDVEDLIDKRREE